MKHESGISEACKKNVWRIEGSVKGNATSSKRKYLQHVERINEGFNEYQMGIFVASVKNKWRIKALERMTWVSRAD